MIPTREQTAQTIYEDTFGEVVEALEPFDLPKATVERVAEEAAELAVDREMDPDNEPDGFEPGED